ncbi:YkvA family protein [Butyricimonas sp.]|jgi:uncharacterized membrane protein YkvA (DUF1232 family)|uniref:YkvA family protein n=1 Tax=Butyricimonas sp. TaxID=1969738 RepID=UPI001B1A9519|nr:DUF1232 domain-containing protein [Butyricimonas sp.]MBO4958471.1 DUF1232 domain-containing protein [Butyricimonas sp.]
MKKEKVINSSALWKKLSDYVRKAGRASARPILLMYQVMKSPKTSKKDKLLIFAALSYLVLPVDLLPAKRLPVLGWLDEVFSLTVVYQRVCKYITPEMEYKVNHTLDKWFPEYKEYEVLTEA